MGHQVHNDNPPADGGATSFTVKLEKRESNLQRYQVAQIYDEEDINAEWYKQIISKLLGDQTDEESAHWNSFKNKLDQENKKLFRDSLLKDAKNDYKTLTTAETNEDDDTTASLHQQYYLTQTAINMKNLYNFQYYGPVYMGTSAREMYVSYDTGSDVSI